MTARQPALGLAGLLLVAPAAWLLAVGAGGAESSLLVLGPLVTFGLPALAMVAFWWEDWPGSRLRPGWSALLDTVLIALAAIALTMLGQSIVGRLDLRGIFDPMPGAQHFATFPATMPLAGTAFVAMLQLTLVCEGWPLQRLRRFTAGAAALAGSWGFALGVYAVVVDVDSRPRAGEQLGALLVLVGALQVWFYVAWRAWPFSAIRDRGPRLLCANVAVVGGALLAYAVAHGLGGVPTTTLTAAAGVFIAAGLLAGMLFDGRRRAVSLAVIVAVAAALYLALEAYADGVEWRRATGEDWVAHAGLNAIGVGVLLHVAVGQRWPLGRIRQAPHAAK